MATLSPPVTWSQLDTSGASYAHIFDQASLELALMDTLDPTETGIVRFRVDLGGTGSDTMRVVGVDGIFWDQRMTALGSETDSITPSSYTNDTTDITVASYGIGYSDTNQQQILRAANISLSLEDLIAGIPMNFLSTLRYLACVQGATYSTIIGGAADSLDADDAYNIAAAVISTDGADALGRPLVTIHKEQLNQWRTSFRSEPAYQAMFQAFVAAAAVPSSNKFMDFMGLGFDVVKTSDVQTSGGAYQGFAHSIGAMGYAVASAGGRLKLPAAAEPIFIDSYGIVIQRKLDGLGNATQGFEARTLVGVTSYPAARTFQRRIRSVV